MYNGSILYHYTDFQAIDGILRCAQLRVNNVLRMNDSAEMRHFMKRLCAAAGVESSKVFPHNLRHLFARTFYEATGDIVKLADMLGHSSIDTTRIYLLATGVEHMHWLDRLKLVC